MKNENILSLLPLPILAIIAGIICNEHFYCNPRATFPLLFVIIFTSTYFSSFSTSDTSKKRDNILSLFIIPIIVLFISFTCISIGYLFTINQNVNYIEFFKFNDSLLYVINILLLLVCLSIFICLISNNKRRYQLYSITISAILTGIFIYLYFMNSELLNNMIISTTTTIIELVISIIGLFILLLKK